MKTLLKTALLSTGLLISGVSAAIDREIAVVVKAEGLVTVGFGSGNTEVFAERGHLLMNRAVVRTGMKGVAQIRFLGSGSTIHVRQESEIVFMADENSAGIADGIRVGAGQAVADVRCPPNATFDLATPATVVTATECVALTVHDETGGGSAVFVLEGSCRAADVDYSGWFTVPAPAALYASVNTTGVRTSPLGNGDRRRIGDFITAARSSGEVRPFTHTIMIRPEQGGSVLPGNVMTVLQGYAVDLQAQADSGFVFTGWEVLDGNAVIAAHGAESTTVSTVTDALLAARFTASPVSLTILSRGQGTTLPCGSVHVPRGSPWKIMARPSPGYAVKKWKTMPGIRVVGSDSVSAMIVADIDSGQVIAEFVRRPVVCQIDISGGGKVKPSGKIKLVAGDSVRLSATAAKKSTFVGWEIAGAGATIDDRHAAVTVLRVKGGDIGVRARFNRTDRTVKVTIRSHERAPIVPSGSCAIPVGDSLMVAATPQAGLELDRWIVSSGDADIEGGEHAIIRPRTNCEITPVVATRTYHLTVGSYGPGTVSPSGLLRAFHALPVTLEALPQPGKVFATWQTVGGNALIADPSSVKTTVTLSSTDAVVGAVFTAAICTLAIGATTGGSTEPAGKMRIYEGKKVAIRALPDSQAAFLGWLIETNGATVLFSDTVTSPEQIVSVRKCGNAKIIARFSTDAVELAVSGNGLGLTEPSRPIRMPKGRWTPVRALAAEGNTFVQWVTVAGAQLEIRDRTSAETEVNPGSAPGTIRAIFAPSGSGRMIEPGTSGAAGPYVLSISSDVNSGAVEPSGTLTLKPGVPATLTATPATQHYFVEWVVGEGSAVVSDRFSRTAAVTLTHGNASIAARFAPRVLQTIDAEFTDPTGLRRSIIIRYR